jgi:DNA invertase Pin-like site-specific DNA recombinase
MRRRGQCAPGREQSHVAEEARSVTRQADHARAFAERKGWRVAEAHIYSDEAISGAEFEKRPGLQRLLRSLEPRPPFDVLIVSEDSRLGREAIETSRVVKTILRSGVRIFAYLDDTEIRLDSALDKITFALRGFGSEQERERATQRSRDTSKRKAISGHVTGGRCYGYRNRDVGGQLDASGRSPRSHVEFVIREDEAAIVREIHELCADGFGYKSIAGILNRKGIPGPRSPEWDSNTVRTILMREKYRGVIVWNKTRKRDEDGKRIFERAKLRRPEAEWFARRGSSAPDRRSGARRARRSGACDSTRGRAALRQADRPPTPETDAVPALEHVAVLVRREFRSLQRALCLLSGAQEGHVHEPGAAPDREDERRHSRYRD